MLRSAVEGAARVAYIPLGAGILVGRELQGLMTQGRSQPAPSNDPDGSRSVAGFTRDGTGRVLLVHTEAHGWTLPTMSLHPDAPLITGLQEFIAEATGLRVEVGRLAGMYADPKNGTVCMLYLCPHTGGDLQTGERAGAAGWFTPTDAVDMITEPLQVDRLRDALRIDAGGMAVHRVYLPHPYNVVLREQEITVVPAPETNGSTAAVAPDAPASHRSGTRPAGVERGGGWRRLLTGLRRRDSAD